MTVTFNRREVRLILRALNHESTTCWNRGDDGLSEEYDQLYDRIYDGEAAQEL